MVQINLDLQKRQESKREQKQEQNQGLGYEDDYFNSSAYVFDFEEFQTTFKDESLVKWADAHDLFWNKL